MIKIETSYSEIMDAVKERLNYIAGKRAIDAEEYFRHCACEADIAMLQELTSEVTAEIAVRLGGFCRGYEIKADLLIYEIQGRKATEEEVSTRQELPAILRAAVIAGIIYRWLCLTGLAGTGEWLGRHDALIANLRDKLNSFGPLVKRRHRIL